MKKLFAFALVALGCDDPLSDAQQIERTRVLGARVEAGGDPSRAWPKPAESVSVRFWVADPRPVPPLGWALFACEAAATTRGVPECASPSFAENRSAGLGTDPPVIDFAAPAAAAGRLLVWGAVCGDGVPDIGASVDTARCDGDLTPVVLPIEIERAPPGNRNPTLADEVFWFDGAAWPAPPVALAERSDCSSTDAAAELPLVSAGSGTHRVGVSVSADDREAGEDLFLSHFSTAGHFDRPLSVIDEPLELAWKAPTSAGTITRFYFVLRDLRGGADFAVRTVCVVP